MTNIKDIIETLHIASIPGLVEEIKAAAEEPLEGCAVYDENEEW